MNTKAFQEQIELHDLREKCNKLEEQRKHANEFIKTVADMLNMDTDGLGYDGLTLSLDDFQNAIRDLNSHLICLTGNL